MGAPPTASVPIVIDRFIRPIGFVLASPNLRAKKEQRITRCKPMQNGCGNG